jgi:Flp pilus assembly pilin Flp
MGLSIYIRQLLARFPKDTSGAVVIEYALICSLISIAAIGGMVVIGGSVNGFFTTISTSLR